MNSFIETLNHWSGNFLDFAGTMLWQSSLLIVILFAADFLFRRKIRASIRYTLWLVLLLKLILPPTLALPTSPVWWLCKTPAAVQAKPQFQNFTVTYGSQSLPEIPKNLTAFAPPKPTLTIPAWLLVISISVSAVLFLWLLARWWQISRQARRAEISERLTALANEARQFAGIKLNPSVKLTANTMSPAVCGLFRPVILIPQSLAEHFSDEQLRAVLLHELIHLRRRDVWVNFLQSLFQIFYWWQPLVWLANARIRRAREEAVDDAVMLALRGAAETYAPTLLEVAKLALNRPLASLGLVGILESRSALRQRIERLVNFSAPRKAGLTLVSTLGILAFTAVAVPMGGAPSGSNSPDAKILPATSTPSPLRVTQVSWTPTNSPQIFIQAEIYRMRQTDFEKIVSDPAFTETKQAKVKNFQLLGRLLKASGFQPISRPRIQTANGLPAQFYIGNEANSVEFECQPFVTNGLIDLTSYVKIISTTENVTTTNHLTSQITLKNGGGHVFSIRQGNGLDESNLVVVTVSAEILKPQIHIKARFIEVPKGKPIDLESLTMSLNANTHEMQGILNHSNLLAVLHRLREDNNAETLAEPEGETSSGRQMMMFSGEEIPIIGSIPSNIKTELSDFDSFRGKLTNNTVVINNKVYQTTPLNAGVEFDAVVSVLTDGQTIQISVKSLDTEFFGFAQTKENDSFPYGEPSIRVRKAEDVVRLYDGQTLMLGGFKSVTSGEEKIPKKANTQLFVFATVTIVDSAGNRIHPDN